MKYLLLALLLSSPCFAATGAGGHGGDPQKIQAKPWPHQKMLANASKLIREKLKAVDYDSQIEMRIITELDQLIRESKFFLIDAITLPPSEEEEHSFISLGAFTKKETGAAVYFAARVEQYPLAQFAELVLHEVLHHASPGDTKEDEDFVSQFAAAIMQERTEKRVKHTLNYGVVSEMKYEHMNHEDRVGIEKALKSWMIPYERALETAVTALIRDIEGPVDYEQLMEFLPLKGKKTVPEIFDSIINKKSELYGWVEFGRNREAQSLSDVLVEIQLAKRIVETLSRPDPEGESAKELLNKIVDIDEYDRTQRFSFLRLSFRGFTRGDGCMLMLNREEGSRNFEIAENCD